MGRGTGSCPWPRLSPTLCPQVTITVLDENDNSPQFDITSDSSVSVAEDSAVGKRVAVVLARDPDAGSNGQVRTLAQQLWGVPPRLWEHSTDAAMPPSASSQHLPPLRIPAGAKSGHQRRRFWGCLCSGYQRSLVKPCSRRGKTLSLSVWGKELCGTRVKRSPAS